MSFSTADFSDWTLLAEGGEGEVFRARQTSLDRQVAIKRLKLTSIGNKDDVRRFEREAKLCASLNHPGLIKIFDYGTEGKFYYLVMEYVPGVDLGKLGATLKDNGIEGNSNVTQDGPGGASGIAGMPETFKIHLAVQMVEVVDFIHQKSVLHRDLKPENFLVDSAANVKLLDLGLAKAQLNPHTDARGGIIQGTLAYLPPELFRGQGPIENVGEYYSLALVILELFLGERYYRGKSADEVVSLIQSGIPVAEMAGVPLGVKTLLAPYLNPDPKARPRNLTSLVKGLKGMQGGTVQFSIGQEALQEVISREHKAWLWSMVLALEASGKIEDAFARLRELLEIDPEDADAQAKFQQLGMKLNDDPSDAGSHDAAGKAGRFIPVKYRKAVKPSLIAAAALIVMMAGCFFYLEWKSRSEDLGRDIMQRELSLLNKESENANAGAAGGGKHVGKPALPPYGVLIVTGLPKDYRLLVNSVVYSADGEIHLPVSRHLLEIEDSGSHPIVRDSISIGGGEPTVYEFARRANKP